MTDKIKQAQEAVEFLEEHCWVDEPAEEVARSRFKTITRALADAEMMREIIKDIIDVTARCEGYEVCQMSNFDEARKLLEEING